MSLVMCWPLAATGHFIAFPDTNAYIAGGDAIWNIVGDMLSSSDGGDAGAAGRGGVGSPTSQLGDTSAVYGRSITYAALFAAVVRTAGPYAMTYLQAFLIVLSIFACIDRVAMQRPVVLTAGFAALLAVSQVAWMTTYLMPDIFGAVVLVFAALLVRRFDEFSVGQRLALTVLAAFAVSTHYGNMPLAFAVVAAALLLRLIRRAPPTIPTRHGLAPLVAGLIVVAVAPTLNLGASMAILGEVSFAPLRPPVTLARSLEDGPARWYIEKQCAEGGELCDVFDGRVPDSHYAFLWGENGLETRDKAAREQIRDREWEIVAAAAMEYPLQQSIAAARNAAYQFIRVAEAGKAFVWTGQEFERGTPSLIMGLSELAMYAATFLSALVLGALLIAGRLTRSQIEILAVIVFGLVVNACVFGVLSAPAPRYQARVEWLLPLLSLLFVAEGALRRRAA
ncbi:hypothetical protein EF888_08720 [Silicimonas algicola]|nr:hypothetical protein [Silicimonas algicola]AZQ67203.1 hypothetical protein EF888_08720 [Silicimonas algicola]